MISYRKLFIAAAIALRVAAGAPDQVKTQNGVVEGIGRQPDGVRIFRGVAFAAPPVGDLRWREPQPVKKWTGVRQAAEFGPRCMQRAVFGDMGFRAKDMSEDCLYLNIWTPAKSATEHLPVLIYFYGGGYMAGDGSEPRYDGEMIARKGVVTITANYRLGPFGFMAHPELTKESPHHASGDYGLLDSAAAIQWVHDNIAAFGGDPKRITIAGESAGSISVSALMASPLSRGLIAGAIGSSGSMMGALPAVPLSEGEGQGVKFGEQLNAPSLAALRAIPAADVLEATAKQGAARFSPTVDGYFLPKSPLEIFAAGEQAHVPLLMGWNSEEQGWRSVIRTGDPTPENLNKAVTDLYKDHAAEASKLFSGQTPDEVMDAATELAGARFTGFSSWKWTDMQLKTGGKPVYRYFYSRARPAMVAAMGNAVAGVAGGVITNPQPNAAAPRRPLPRGAVHSAEIEYAMGNLATNKTYAWTPDDFKISDIFQNFYANFVKTGNPNGPGVPQWPAAKPNAPVEVMRIDVESKASPETHRDRWLFLDQLSMK